MVWRMSKGRVLYPDAQAARFRWLYLGVLAQRYPDKMRRLEEAVPWYVAAREEKSLPPDVAGLRELPWYSVGFGPWHQYSPAVAHLLYFVKLWAHELRLTTIVNGHPETPEWLEGYAISILIPALAGDANLSVATVCFEHGNSSYLDGEPSIELGPDDPKPSPISANPQHESEKKFVDRARKHYKEQGEWLKRRGYADELNKRKVLKHLSWLAEHVVEDVNPLDLATKGWLPGGEDPDVSSIAKQIKSYAAWIGVDRGRA